MTYAPYLPLDTLKPFGDELWIVDGAVIDYRLAGVSIPCPTRMTVARLQDGLWVHSPTALTDRVRVGVAMLGTVAHIVVPNRLHTRHASAWAAAFPDATVHAPSGLSGSDAVPPHEVLGDRPPAAWGGEFDIEIVSGDGFVEAVFHHHRSRTLIVTDLMQTFEAEWVDSPVARTLLRLGGATGPVGRPSIEVRLMLVPAFACLPAIGDAHEGMGVRTHRARARSVLRGGRHGRAGPGLPQPKNSGVSL